MNNPDIVNELILTRDNLYRYSRDKSIDKSIDKLEVVDFSCLNAIWKARNVIFRDNDGKEVYLKKNLSYDANWMEKLL